MQSFTVKSEPKFQTSTDLTSHKGDIEVEKVPIQEAIKALETLKLWEIQQENGEVPVLQTLEQIGRRIQQNQLQSMKQSTLYSFFQRN